MSTSSLNGDTKHLLAESHEDRLQKVEGTLQEVAVSLATVQTKQDYMAEAIETTSKNIIEKLEEVGCKVGSFESRLSPLEGAHRANVARKRLIGSGIKAVLLALGGAIATGAGTWIWEHLIK